MIEVLYSTGLRRAELARLAAADYDPARRSLHVRGKGNKERRIFLTRSAAARVDAWLAGRGGPDSAHNAEKFMDDWLATIKNVAPAK
jgi:site-specific recombinase XerD